MKYIPILLLTVLISSCMTTKELPTVDRVDVDKYSGLWYEIARLPNSFEKGMECVTANYTLKKNGKIEVLNRGFIEEKGKYKTARGTAWIPSSEFPGRLKVTFFWPFSGNYYIISLDEEYAHVLVGDPSRKYLWVLSRTRELDESIYSELMGIAERNGFDSSAVLRIRHDCEQ